MSTVITNELAEQIAGLKSAEVLEGSDITSRLLARTFAPPESAYTNLRQNDAGEVTQLFKTVHSKGIAIVGVEEAKALAQRRGVDWRDEYEGRVIRQWASDQRVDHHGDIVLQNFDFTQFATNPAMPFNHTWEGLPVGVHLDWLIAQKTEADYTGPALLLASLFAAEDEMPPAWGDSLFRLVRAQMLRANSIGFIPRKIIIINDETEREKLGLGRWGDILDDNLLLEDSPTLLGANAGALTILNSAKDEGFLRAADFRVIRELSRRALHDTPDKWKQEDSEWVKMARILFPSDEFKKAEDVDEPLFEKEIGDKDAESLEIEVPAAEEKQSGEELILAKLQQLINLTEMGLLGLQTQLDSLTDGLADAEASILESTNGKEPDESITETTTSLVSRLLTTEPSA